MKKIFLMMAFAGILGSATAATINFTTSSNALITANTGDDKHKKKDKNKEKDKTCCKKDGKEGKACCKKKTEEKETSNATKK